MFFPLRRVEGHRCEQLQAAVEFFFYTSIDQSQFSVSSLFPSWFHSTLNKASSTLAAKFCAVHAALHVAGRSRSFRMSIYMQVVLSGRVEDQCAGGLKKPWRIDRFDQRALKGVKAPIVQLMESLYEALDLAVFRENGMPLTLTPTQHLYREFIRKNVPLCACCALVNLRNHLGARREDFDHYLNKSTYPFGAVCLFNLVPVCSICNQDYKKDQDVLECRMFFPYAQNLPAVRLTVSCSRYPLPATFDDRGDWEVNITCENRLDERRFAEHIEAWDRIYSIRTRLVNEVKQFFEEWMELVLDQVEGKLDEQGSDILTAGDGACAKAPKVRVDFRPA